MTPKATSHVIQGMQKDTSKSKLSREFAFDAKNIRITAREDNSLLTVTNEKGNSKLIELSGYYIGHYVLNNQLVLFTTTPNAGIKDHIFLYNSEFIKTQLYSGNLKFSLDNPIEALGVYENEDIQKVYWVDGRNQPRVINIAAKYNERIRWNDKSFDFIQELELNESIQVLESNKASSFAPGVIQYAFSYIGKNKQESNIFYTTPLFKLTHFNRGASPEETITNQSFDINIQNLDANNKYIRIYSIHRTSINSVPTVKLLGNFEIPEDKKVNISDTGTLGESIDPSLLLYIGGEYIIPNTIVHKDNTLFLGNITLKKDDNFENAKALLLKECKNNVESISSGISISKDIHGQAIYPTEYKHALSHFKNGEHYMVGVQLQDNTGKWSLPIYIKTITIDTQYPYTINHGSIIYYRPIIKITGLTESTYNSLVDMGYKRIRGVIVYPEDVDKKVLAQGILCPTVYNEEERKNNNPHVKSSWFLRPNLTQDFTSSSINATQTSGREGAYVEFRHSNPILYGKNSGSEIQNGYEYKIDQSFLTFHSPDIEFGNTQSYDGLNLRIVGHVNFTSNYGRIDIQASAPKNSKSKGFYNKNINNSRKSLVSGLFYNDDVSDYNNAYIMTYPWQQSGSISGVDNYSVLNKKIISNIKFSFKNVWLKNSSISNWEPSGGISNIELFDNISNKLIKIDSTYNYFGEEDKLLFIPVGEDISLYYGIAEDLYDSSLSSVSIDSASVRLSYKSTPHLILKLNDVKKEIKLSPEVTREVTQTCILPSLNNFNNIDIPTPQYIPNDSDWVKAQYRTTTTNTSATPPTYVGYQSEGEYYIVHVVGNQSASRVYKLINRGNLAWVEQNAKAYFIENNYIHKYDTTSAMSSNCNYTVDIIKISEISQDNIRINSTPSGPFLYIAELYRSDDLVKNAFNSFSEKNNIWLPASTPIPLSSFKKDGNGLSLTYGDTNYNRYDCLKTYAYSSDHENQIVEIASFMCETRINMLGRYDKNIGNLSNLYANPTNFNLLNPVYSQKDNFFNYRILDEDLYKRNSFPNTITWSKEKHAGEELDTWTNITMASTLDLDGTKGGVNKLIVHNNRILAFQEKGIAEVLFNSRVQIPTSDGVPIEITNGYKVEGFRYISDGIGSKNKNSITVTPSGVYFLDSNSNSIYLLTDGLTNLSTEKGFEIWTKKVANDSSFKTFYDSADKDVYFTTSEECLGYSEKLRQFTSFYDYNDVETMFNIGTGFYSIKENGGTQSIYQHSVGNYNEFYGEIKPYHLTIISNEDPQVDKVFTNLDYRADFFDSDNNYLENESFDTLEVWNEYQRGKETLKYSKFRPSNLKKKFRMWGATIPRDRNNKLDRMRNPWLYIKLSKENPRTSKMELHDLVVKYLE